MRDDGTFDLNSLREALNVGQPRPVPTLAQTEQNHPLRGGPIPNRTDEQKARDFEVGFLGEQYVSLAAVLSRHVRSVLKVDFCLGVHLAT